MDVQGPVIVTYVYQLVDGEVSRELASRVSACERADVQVKVDKVEYRRPEPPKDEHAAAHRSEVATGW